MASADGVLSWLVLLWLLAFASAVWSTDGWHVDVMAMAAGCDDGVDDGSTYAACPRDEQQQMMRLVVVMRWAC